MAIIDVVKYNGDPDIFAWKFPKEDLTTMTQLIVNESQEALLFKGGKAYDLFTAGTYTLETNNIPLLNHVVNIPFGGKSPFSAEVWFISKTFNLNVKWGTASPIQLQDPKYNVFVPVRSYGQFGIQIEDARKFIFKIVGTLPSFGKQQIHDYVRGIYLTKVKDAISSFIIKEKISVLEINASLEELSEYLMEKTAPLLAEYGIKLLNFYVNDINIPENDQAVIKLKEALAKRAEMDIVGYNYIQQRSFDTLEGAATNPGSAQSSMMGAGLGLGMGVGMGGSLGGQFSEMAQNIHTGAKKTCPKCGASLNEDQRFCDKCGSDTKADAGSKFVICKKCGEKNHSGVKFCVECGNALMRKCPSCEALIHSDKVKFCPECGTSLVKQCPNCKTPINGELKFCPECGEKLS